MRVGFWLWFQKGNKSIADTVFKTTIFFIRTKKYISIKNKHTIPSIKTKEKNHYFVILLCAANIASAQLKCLHLPNTNHKAGLCALGQY
jgi:hypothetical protein